jgi:hypothetical protein
MWRFAATSFHQALLEITESPSGPLELYKSLARWTVAYQRLGYSDNTHGFRECVILAVDHDLIYVYLN